MALAEARGPSRRRLALWIWSVAVLIIWGVSWLTYADVVDINTCLLGNASGGRVRSDGWAGGIGIILLVLTALLAFRSRRRLLLLSAGFLVVYVATLVVLWQLSPALWGATACSGGSF